MAGNAVGPVALIAAGVWFGYITLTGRAANFVAFLQSGGTSLDKQSSAGGSGSSSTPDPTSTPTTDPNAGDNAAQKAIFEQTWAGAIENWINTGSTSGTSGTTTPSHAAAAAVQSPVQGDLQTFYARLYGMSN